MEGNINKIIKYGYDNLAQELIKQGKSDNEIAKILTGLHPDKNISKACVLRFRNIKPRLENVNIKNLANLKSDINLALDKTYDHLGVTYNKKRTCNKIWSNIYNEIDYIIGSEEANKKVLEDRYKEVIRQIQLDYARRVIEPLLNMLTKDYPEARKLFYELNNSFFDNHKGEA